MHSSHILPVWLDRERERERWNYSSLNSMETGNIRSNLNGLIWWWPLSSRSFHSNLTFTMGYFKQYAHTDNSSQQINGVCLKFIEIQWNYIEYIFWVRGFINLLQNSIDIIQFSVNLIPALSHVCIDRNQPNRLVNHVHFVLNARLTAHTNIVIVYVNF